MNESLPPLVLDRTAPYDADGLTPTVQALFGQMMCGTVIDFTDLPLDQVNGMQLAVALRATNPLILKDRTKVLGWEEALEVAKLALQRDGLDWKDALWNLF